MKDYKKILEGIVNIISTTEKSDTVSNICSYIDENCPELTESKDERIRKRLIEYFNDDVEIIFNDDLKMEDILVWLEKQGKEEYALKSSNKEDVFKFMERITKLAKDYELNLPNRSYDIYGFAKDLLAWLERQQDNNKPDFRERYEKVVKSEWFKKTYEDKSCGIDSVSIDEVDKVKPKFHKGDWIIFNGSILYVNEVVQGYYRTISRDGIYNSYDWGIDYAARHWTIEEAKDGDVLVSTSHECYVIFKEIDGLNIKCYFTYHLNVGSIPMFYVNTLQNKTAFCPVTDEEREIFLEKVKEFGYKWDSENKKLFKI